MHPRKLIRKKATEIIGGALSAVNGSVVPNRADPSWQEDLPAFSVYTTSEEIEELTQAPRELKRTLELAVECAGEGESESDLSDKLDDYAEIVENIMGLNETLGGTCSDLILSRTRMKIAEEGEVLTGAVVLFFDVVYVTPVVKDSVSQASDDLNTMHADWRVGHNGEQTDTVTDAETLVEFSEQ